MPTRVLFVGLDAAEATLIERWASKGALPCFARLSHQGAIFPLENSLETLPGAIWPEICTGISCGRRAQFYHPAQLHTGESRIRRLTKDDVDPREYFWTQASDAGCRVAVVDVPQTVATPDLNGVHVREWGLHDRNFSISSSPPELLADLRSRYGDHPVQNRACDTKAEAEGHAQLLDDLLDGARRKTELLLDVLDRDSWDLFVCAFGETHCVGHQFWHFDDPDHPRHDPAAPPRLRDAIKSVYQSVDQGIERLIAASGPDTIVLVVASHGMGPYIGGPQLLPEVLVRLGMASQPDSPWRRRLRQAHNKARYLPWGAKRLLRPLLDVSAVRKAQASVGALLDPFESPGTRAGAVKNNRCGAIRLNLKGREPYGAVAPGEDAEGLIAELRRELLALEDLKTGEPIVCKVVTAEETFGPDHHPDVPDLMVVFRTDLGRLEACRSSSVGLVEAPINSPGYPRTGDHTVESRLWIAGPGVPAGQRLADASVLDLAPTILQVLSVPQRANLDGKALLSTRFGNASRREQEQHTDSLTS